MTAIAVVAQSVLLRLQELRASIYQTTQGNQFLTTPPTTVMASRSFAKGDKVGVVSPNDACDTGQHGRHLKLFSRRCNKQNGSSVESAWVLCFVK